MTKRKAYPTDLSDKEWALLEPLLPTQRTGRPRKYSQREMLNAILYITRTGCSWRMMPHDLPPWQAVYAYFRKLMGEGAWEEVNDTLREAVRQQAGREAHPSMLIVDSQSVKTTEKGGPRGYDGGKRVKGRKRHLVVDSLGLLVRVMVHAANIQDRVGIRPLLCRVPYTSRWQRVVVDGGYATPANEAWCAKLFDVAYEVVQRIKDTGFVILPHRWVVERTFAWLGKYRRLSKDYEALPAVSEAFIYVASVHILVRRLAQSERT